MVLTQKQNNLLNSCPVLKECKDVIGGSSGEGGVSSVSWSDVQDKPSIPTSVSDLNCSTVEAVVTYSDNSTETLLLVVQTPQP